jgi:hypothetical protein
MDNNFRERIAQAIINGASIHRVAERITKEIRAVNRRSNRTTIQLVAANKLAFVYKMDFHNALAIIEEMDP